MKPRKSTESDIPALNALFEKVFGEKRDPEVWVWKYFSNPIGAHSWVWESEQGEIVFHCGATEAPFRNRGSSMRAAQLTDFMSDRSHPGGIGPGSPFGRTVAAFFEDLISSGRVSILYGFPGERHRLVGEKLLGYQVIGRVGEIVLQPETDDVALSALGPSDLDEIAGQELETGIVRNRPWLHWRYLSRPDRAYQFMSGPGFAAIVLKGGEQHHLMEIHLRAPEAAQEAVASLRRLGLPVTGWFSLGHPTVERLVQAGFDSSKRDHFLTAARFREEPDLRARDYFAPAGAVGEPLYFTLGDYDVQ